MKNGISCFSDRERVCPICGEMFILPPQNVYKLTIKGVILHYCSYTCFRKAQKRKERNKKRK